MSRVDAETPIQPDGGLLSVLGDVIFAAVILVMIYPFFKRTVRQMDRQFFSQAVYTFQVLLAVAALGFALMLLVAQQMRVTYCSFIRPYVGDVQSDKAFVLLKLMVCFLLVFNYFCASYLQRAVSAVLNRFNPDRNRAGLALHSRTSLTKTARRERCPQLFSTRDAFVNNSNTNSQTPVTQTQTVMRSDILGCMSNSTLSTESYNYKMRISLSHERMYRDVGTMVRFPEFPCTNSSTFSLHLGRGVGFVAEPRSSSSLPGTLSYSNSWQVPCCSSSTTFASYHLHPSSGSSSMGFSTAAEMRSSYMSEAMPHNPNNSGSQFLATSTANKGFHNVNPDDDTSEESEQSQRLVMDSGRGTMEQSQAESMDSRRSTLVSPDTPESSRGTMVLSDTVESRRGTMAAPESRRETLARSDTTESRRSNFGRSDTTESRRSNLARFEPDENEPGTSAQSFKGNAGLCMDARQSEGGQSYRINMVQEEKMDIDEIRGRYPYPCSSLGCNPCVPVSTCGKSAAPCTDICAQVPHYSVATDCPRSSGCGGTLPITTVTYQTYSTCAPPGTCTNGPCSFPATFPPNTCIGGGGCGVGYPNICISGPGTSQGMSRSSSCHSCCHQSQPCQSQPCQSQPCQTRPCQTRPCQTRGRSKSHGRGKRSKSKRKSSRRKSKCTTCSSSTHSSRGSCTNQTCPIRRGSYVQHQVCGGGGNPCCPNSSCCIRGNSFCGSGSCTPKTTKGNSYCPKGSCPTGRATCYQQPMCCGNPCSHPCSSRINMLCGGSTCCGVYNTKSKANTSGGQKPTCSGRNKLCLQQPACPGTFLQQLSLCPEVTRLMSGLNLMSNPQNSCHSLRNTCGPCYPRPSCSCCPPGTARCRARRPLPLMPKCTRSGKIYGWG